MSLVDLEAPSLIMSPMQDPNNWYRESDSAFRPSHTSVAVDDIELRAYIDYLNTRLLLTNYDLPPVFLKEINNGLATDAFKNRQARILVVT